MITNARPASTLADCTQAQEATARAQATRDQMLRGRSRRQVLHDSAFARLQAKQETMPVIEQAKGIIMAYHGCEPGEAFDTLRRRSQQTNVKVCVLAAQIVEHAVSGGNNDNVTPITLGAVRDLRSGTGVRPSPDDASRNPLAP